MARKETESNCIYCGVPIISVWRNQYQHSKYCQKCIDKHVWVRGFRFIPQQAEEVRHE